MKTELECFEWSMKGKRYILRISDRLDIPYLNEYDYSVTNDGKYFYDENAYNGLFAFLSTEVGGAIDFLNKGRWSGNASSFSESFGQEMVEAVVNNRGGYAVLVNSEIVQNFLYEHPNVDIENGVFVEYFDNE